MAAPGVTRERFACSRVLAACLCGLLLVAGVRAAADTLPSQAGGRGVLGHRAGILRATRLVPIRQPAVERTRVAAIIPDLTRTVQARRRLPRGRSRAELHLHGRAAAADGVHLRHQARQHGAPPDVQGVVRIVRGPRRVRVAPVLPKAAGRTDRELHGGGDLRCVLARDDDRIAVRRERPGRGEPPHADARVSRSRRTTCCGCSTTIARSICTDPTIQYSSNKNGGRRGTEPTYADLMAATDGSGELRAFLASEESFLLSEAAGNRQSGRAADRQLRRDRRRSAPSAST